MSWSHIIVMIVPSAAVIISAYVTHARLIEIHVLVNARLTHALETIDELKAEIVRLHKGV
jgi:hypothetical protein